MAEREAPTSETADGPKLGALPTPARRGRTLALALVTLTAAASLLMAGAMYPEARYAFQSSEPVDVRDLATAQLGPQHDGRFVRAWVRLDGAQAVAFRRVGEPERRIELAESAAPGGGPGSAESPRFVAYALPRDAKSRFLPPVRVAGRLTRVGELGLMYRGLSQPLDGLARGAGATGWVLVDGEEPHAAEWAVALELVLLGFFAYGVTSIWRIVRRLPASP